MSRGFLRTFRHFVEHPDRQDMVRPSSRYLPTPDDEYWGEDFWGEDRPTSPPVIGADD